MLARLLILLAVLLLARPAAADGYRDAVQALGEGGFKDRVAAVQALAALGDPRAVPVLQALMDGRLHTLKDDGRVVLEREAEPPALLDPATLEPLAGAEGARTSKIKVNNSVRGALRGALGGLQLMDPDPARRAAAAAAVFKTPSADLLPALDAALAQEQVSGVRTALARARAATILASEADAGSKLEAVETLAGFPDREVKDLLSALAAGQDETLAAAARDGLAGIEQSLALWNLAGDLFRGVSLGSVLLLAAIGLAITFGVMGVINMAHGEMVMLGAYTTFVVQEAFRNHLPAGFDWSLAVAVPAAFLVAGAAGVVIERGVIRFLYGRPLETLLATWGLSLVLQQAVRTIFGPTNREVGNPGWMSGAMEVGGLVLTYNRIWIIVFSFAVLFGLMALMRLTPFGLQLRAVTQNRRMAGSMGIRTGRVDALTFGLGSGIAGMAGVALSQIDNVSPNLGQAYIIDSFLVVVFGGVGNLWGTLVGALSLGIVNKFLEPWAGAVLGKILVLVLIILFIQKRPRGLFALKGRAVEG